MTTPTALFHAYLRPSVLQILRATGYHGTSPAVLDTVTDLAARYLSLLCEKTAARANHHYGDAGDFTLVEIRLALEEAGALLPQTVATEQEWRGQEDVRGVEEFVRWFTGPRMREIMEFAKGDGETVDMVYLYGEFQELSLSLSLSLSPSLLGGSLMAKVGWANTTRLF